MIDFEELKKGVIGKTVEKATEWLGKSGMSLRIIKIDEEKLFVTQELVEKRINVGIKLAKPVTDYEAIDYNALGQELVTEVINLG